MDINSHTKGCNGLYAVPLKPTENSEKMSDAISVISGTSETMGAVINILSSIKDLIQYPASRREPHGRKRKT